MPNPLASSLPSVLSLWTKPYTLRLGHSSLLDKSIHLSFGGLYLKHPFHALVKHRDVTLLSVTCLFTCLFTCRPTCLSICLSTYLSTCLSICLSICLSTCRGEISENTTTLPAYLRRRPDDYSPIYLSPVCHLSIYYLSTYLSIYLFICLFIYLSTYLSTCREEISDNTTALSAYLRRRLDDYSPTYLSIHLFIHLFIYH